jgi:hypothetical protein
MPIDLLLDGIGSAQKTTVGIGINDLEGLGQGFHLEARLVTMPLAVRPLPKNPPDSQTGHVLKLGDGFFKLGKDNRPTPSISTLGMGISSVPTIILARPFDFAQQHFEANETLIVFDFNRIPGPRRR